MTDTAIHWTISVDQTHHAVWQLVPKNWLALALPEWWHAAHPG